MKGKLDFMPINDLYENGSQTEAFSGIVLYKNE